MCCLARRVNACRKFYSNPSWNGWRTGQWNDVDGGPRRGDVAGDHDIARRCGNLGYHRQEHVTCTAQVLKLGRGTAYGTAECVGATSGLLAHHVVSYAKLDT